jgi:hypothetical protein
MEYASSNAAAFATGQARNNISTCHHGAPVFATPEAFDHQCSFSHAMNGGFLEQRVGEKRVSQQPMANDKSSSQTRRR